MTKLTLKRIDPMKWAIVSALLYAVMSLIIMIPMFLIMSAIGSLTELEETGFAMMGSGIAMLFVPILYGIIGFIFGLLFAVIFNFVLSKTNGLDMEFDTNDLDTTDSSAY